MFYYFLILFSPQSWCTCPIAQMRALKLRQAKKLAHSHTEKAWGEQDFIPGMSDSRPEVPMPYPLQSLFREMNISSPVLSRPFLLILKTTAYPCHSSRDVFCQQLLIKCGCQQRFLTSVKEAAPHPSLFWFPINVSHLFRQNQKDPGLQCMASNHHKCSPRNHLTPGGFSPQRWRMRLLFNFQIPFYFRLLFFASFYLQNLSPTHLTALKNILFLICPVTGPLKIATNNCFLLLSEICNLKISFWSDRVLRTLQLIYRQSQSRNGNALTSKGYFINRIYILCL